MVIGSIAIHFLKFYKSSFILFLRYLTCFIGTFLSRCRGDVILDAFCGSGGNSIQLGRTCEHVIGVDIDPAKLAIAKHNSNIYGSLNFFYLLIFAIIACSTQIVHSAPLLVQSLLKISWLHVELRIVSLR